MKSPSQMIPSTLVVVKPLPSNIGGSFFLSSASEQSDVTAVPALKVQTILLAKTANANMKNGS